MNDKKKLDVYEIITLKFIEALEEGRIPWEKPWRGGYANMPKSYISKKEYRGSNVWLLALQGYDSPYWITYKQATNKGGQVKKGEHGTIISFWSPIVKRDKDTGEEIGKGFMLRYYRVFNFEQCEGLKNPDENKAEEEDVLDFDPIHNCESILEAYKDKPEISEGGGQASYSSSIDKVCVPKKEKFKSVPAWYSTLFHELVHSTGHSNRCDRDMGNWFGTDPYAKEELVAEMGATFLCGIAGIEKDTIDNSKAYIQGWIAKLKNDKRLIINASSLAQKACDYMLGKQWGEANDQAQATKD